MNTSYYAPSRRPARIISTGSTGQVATFVGATCAAARDVVGAKKLKRT